MAERIFTPGYKTSTRSAAEHGNKFPLPDAPDLKSPGNPYLGPYHELDRLLALLQAKDPSRLLSKRFPLPLAIDELEMLEAELHNQGILPRLPDISCSLFQHALHEENLWRWRARRSGRFCPGLEFSVSLPAYVAARALDLRQALKPQGSSPTSSDSLLHREVLPFAAGTTNPELALAELNYLEKFAAYICGGFEEATNRYQRGLNVVLRALSRSSSEKTPLNHTAPSDGRVLHICLPINRHDFFRQIRTCRRGLS